MPGLRDAGPDVAGLRVWCCDDVPVEDVPQVLPRAGRATDKAETAATEARPACGFSEACSLPFLPGNACPRDGGWVVRVLPFGVAGGPQDVPGGRVSARTLETVIALLDSWADVCQPDTPERGIRGQLDSRSPRMDPRYHAGTYRELEEACRALREVNPSVYWHVREWWLKPVKVQRWTQIRRGSGEWAWGWKMIPRRHPHAVEARALAGAGWIDESWERLADSLPRFRRVPQLPPPKCEGCRRRVEKCRCGNALKEAA